MDANVSRFSDLAVPLASVSRGTTATPSFLWLRQAAIEQVGRGLEDYGPPQEGGASRTRGSELIWLHNQPTVCHLCAANLERRRRHRCKLSAV